MKKNTANKKFEPVEDKAETSEPVQSSMIESESSEEESAPLSDAGPVTIRIKPGRGIGGIGGPGTVFTASAEEAKQWIEDGYAEEYSATSEPVQSSAIEGESSEEEPAPMWPPQSPRNSSTNKKKED